MARGVSRNIYHLKCGKTCAEQTGVAFGQGDIPVRNGLMGGAIDGGIPGCGQFGDAADMIRVMVSDQDGCQRSIPGSEPAPNRVGLTGVHHHDSGPGGDCPDVVVAKGG